jgi:hypothetical protein
MKFYRDRETLLTRNLYRGRETAISSAAAETL